MVLSDDFASSLIRFISSSVQTTTIRPNFLSSGALLGPVVPTGRPVPSLYQPLILNLQN